MLTKPIGVITVSMFTTTLILTIFGGFGYWAFGTMEENLLRSLPFDDEYEIFTSRYLTNIKNVKSREGH